MEESMNSLELVKVPTTYKLVITEEVERMIRHLCQKMPNIEWSGVLFYTYEGSMETNDLVLTCRDLYLMDIGVSSYTEFDMSPDVIGYMALKPELLDMQMGLFHSHNQMSCFFSGTDTATLHEEGRDRNHFLSLIVNNAGSYEAAVTRKVKYTSTVIEKYTYNSFNDEVKEGQREYEKENEAIEYYMLDIEKEGKNYSFKELDDRLDEIKKKKESEKNYKPKKDQPTKYNSSSGWGIKPNAIPNLFDSHINDFPSTNIKEKPKELKEVTDNINMNDVNSVLCQMVTGSIILKDYESFDIDKWVEKEMELTFNKRFGNSSIGMKDYESWADGFCEFLIFNVEPEILDGREEAQWMSDFCDALLIMLESLHENKYINALKNTIMQWII